MALYARGTHAKGLCDRCGFAYPLRELRGEVVNLLHTNTLVCPDCWDEDHPQLQAGKKPVIDAEVLRNARPDPRDAGLTNIRWGWNPVFGSEAQAQLGQVSVTTD